ncbi:sigma factor-like helix-turn-helix DNA-binding protein [Streptomyces sp. HB2AG]|uniref:sigma factor-like helix-turn-helix DNA-binding protein n=1 Tax=Streptomyces sp. HB2AG TaxID=2983400 RepID=UPI0022AAF6F7|nr:sigma factor-like helix-turn-helix DNA-binding protein [Streptomyces sp. HB2AG]MCZ2527681.1 sigma factor-like helix-turn-helix DNA-binding protein [Streptomyces sp. HB2AG]
MGKRHEAAAERRDREFEGFVAGAAGRLLHAATLLTGDRAAAERLVERALARTWACWLQLRDEDPYALARLELVTAYDRGWGPLSPRARRGGGVLARLAPRERLVLVLRLVEGVDEEQVAAQLGLPVDRVRALLSRACTVMRSGPAGPGGGPVGPTGPAVAAGAVGTGRGLRGLRGLPGRPRAEGGPR